MGIGIFLLVVFAAIVTGANILQFMRLRPPFVAACVLMSAAIGFVFIGYGVLLLGLFHALTGQAIVIFLAGLSATGFAQTKLIKEGLKKSIHFIGDKRRQPLQAFFVIFLGLIVAGTFITALEPPAGRDFDGLAEHLAQAAYYARHHCVEPLWHDHHSHFPATMQMLYTIALLGGSVSAAKLFHWLHSLMALAAVGIIARDFFRKEAAVPAMFVLAVSPMFIWLSGLAYVDLALMAYGLLALWAFLHWQATAQPRYLLLAAFLASCGMAVKMQGIALFGVLMAAALFVRPQKGIEGQTDTLSRFSAPIAAAKRQETLMPCNRGFPLNWRWRLQWTALAALLGALWAAPWYVRSAINTGNPFYPFAYSIFGGKHWTADRALAYQRHQLEFGLGELPAQEKIEALPRWQRYFVGPREPWKFFFAPLGLTFLPWEYEVNIGPLQNLLSSIGPLWLALLPLLGFVRLRPPAVALIGKLFVPLYIWWFFSMQLARYLLPMLALWTPAAGFAAIMFLCCGRLSRYLAGAAMLFTGAIALGIVYLLSAPALPVVLGQETQETYLMRQLDVYEPSLYIRRYTPPDAIIATYGEVRTFYFARDVIWAEYGHSDLIPYPQLRNATQLVEKLRELGVTHVFINLTHLPGFWTAQDNTLRLLREAIQSGELLFVQAFALHPQFLLFAIPQKGGGR